MERLYIPTGVLTFMITRRQQGVHQLDFRFT